MRIALLSDLFYPYQLGGAERQFFEIAVRLAKKHDVHVFTMNLDGQPKEEVIKNIHVHRIGIKHPLNRRSLLSLLTYFLSSKLKGNSKQLAMFQVAYNNVGALMMVPLFYIEVYTGVPLVKAFAEWIASDSGTQIAIIFLLFKQENSATIRLK